MSALSTLAAAPDAIAPWYAAVLALLSFVVLMLLAFSGSPTAGPSTTASSTPGETPTVEQSADNS